MKSFSLLFLGFWMYVSLTGQKLFTVEATDYIFGSYEEIQEGMAGCCKEFCAENLVASSTLANQGENSYGVEMLKDDACQTAWVEGANGDGIGEYIEFEYSYDDAYAQSAEYACKYTDEFLIVNGYQKDKTTFLQNNRVKKIKMYIDGKPYCWILLKDKLGVQLVKLGFIKKLGKKAKTIKIKFEIAEVYKGTQYNDTAISEIFW